MDNCGICDNDPSKDCGWTRETTLVCWQEPGTTDPIQEIDHFGMVSQVECFQACDDTPGCDAIFQYKYSYESNSRSCWLFSQSNCYDSGTMQAEIVSGWETWIRE